MKPLVDKYFSMFQKIHPLRGISIVEDHLSLGVAAGLKMAREQAQLILS